MEVNIVAFVATALFILIPTAFLLILYIQTAARNND
uniref:Photosystem II reaction center protein M n=4 Tax=Vittarioideae TaxID=29626 RepID=A0A3G5CUK2_9MONI|nr:photosystem II protein M [Antrophyum semicostatum]YP_009549265.1 photosystem II protein M [Vittaria graminifolia]YP_009549351.1 photosystem II protein M [Scoliosorus ensiformis]YP_009549438.1 photosystem II protein M [Vittaria appalachiana]AYW16240.1 photosystem II protein M [Antrophyum semicostatum]AYW16414.1 photosystem II protein M [Vittaria graminifolia]AYW16500.1 photosystem II protein M [Scoliosorus ensiformis]AYW16587.1 photosystem II protein M [Vittaria appalachiana]